MVDKYKPNETKIRGLKNCLEMRQLILRGEHISLTELMLLEKLPSGVKSFSLESKKGCSARYWVEFYCCRCGALCHKEIGKTCLVSNDKYDFLCSQCEEIEKNMQEQQRHKEWERKLNMAAEERKTREQLLDFWCCPTARFEDIGVKAEGIQKWYELQKYLFDFDYEANRKLSNLLCGLEYRDFLKTPYWDAVREKIRRRDRFMCCLCGSKLGLRVHHKTYEHHGREADYLQDLLLLCENCHKKFHNREEE